MLLGAAVLSLVAGRIGVPYPTLLALAGAALAFAPGMPHLAVPPELILALFVAPVLLDAAHDASWRDLKTNWRPVLSLVLVAVGLTTITVAVVARLLVPDMSWAAAIALGALLAPPDAVAALAVMRAVSPPHRLRVVLEGESLFNDASALLIYKLALTSVAVGTFSIGNVAPALLLVSVGSAAAGWILAKLVTRLTALVRDPAIATIIQFVGTFGVWLLAERLELSGVITVVVFGVTAGRRSSGASFTEVRIKSFAAWDTATRILNVLAFTMVGLQLRPIAASLNAAQARDYPLYALAILAIVIVVRLIWVLLYGAARLISGSRPDEMLGTWSGTLKSGLVVGWSGMRGIVTIAAALALPQDFPQREFIQLVAFVVVLGTLVLQGLTLKPLLKALRFPADTVVAEEIRRAREAAARAALRALDGRQGEAAERLRQHLAKGVATSERGDDMFSAESGLRLAVLPASRKALDQLRERGEIGDDAFRFVEQELDWSELAAQSHRYEQPRAPAGPSLILNIGPISVGTTLVLPALLLAGRTMAADRSDLDTRHTGTVCQQAPAEVARLTTVGARDRNAIDLLPDAGGRCAASIADMKKGPARQSVAGPFLSEEAGAAGTMVPRRPVFVSAAVR